jgi:hypothetical protein
MGAQDEATQAIHSGREQGRRAASYGATTLNRNPRVLRGIRKAYERRAARLGFRPDQIAAQWNDVLDMAKLEAASK